MVSPENNTTNTNWLYDYGLIDDDDVIPIGGGGSATVPVTAANDCTFIGGGNFNCWPPIQPLSNTALINPNFCLEIDGTIGDLETPKETTSKKRARPEACASSSSKACREKLRRDKLNDKFVELGTILEPGRTPKTDKSAILVDAVRMVTQLRDEAQKLKDSNSSLQEKIKELKAEKNELREEKQRLKSEKDRLEQQLKTTNAQPGFMAPPSIPAAFAAQTQTAGNKLVPIISYPGVAMWQFMPPAAVDTSQDHVLRPPVA